MIRLAAATFLVCTLLGQAWAAPFQAPRATTPISPSPPIRIQPISPPPPPPAIRQQTPIVVPPPCTLERQALRLC